MIEKLVLIRHAEYTRNTQLIDGGRINDKGIEQAKAIAPVIRHLIEQAKKEELAFDGFRSSHRRMAIETAFVIGDELGGLESLDTHESLYYDSCEELYNYTQRGNIFGLVVAVGHKEVIDNFPDFLIKEKNWNQSELKRRDYCQGYYHDFNSKTFKLVPENIQVTP